MENQQISNNKAARLSYNKNALLLGKDKALQEMMACLLMEMGLTCKSCYIEDYNKILKQLQPAFIVIDCTVQCEESQYDSIMYYRVEPIPVILLSPYPESGLSNSYNTNHIFLEKPFNLKEFTGSVKKLLDKQANH